MKIRQQAKDDHNDGLAQFAKIVLNSAFGGDCLNSEKYSNTKLLSSERTFLQHMMNGFIHSTELNDDLYAVQVDKESCRCNTCLQVAYFVLDSAKFWMHFVQCDTDSLTWAISGDSNRGPDQLFDAVIKDQQYYDTYKDSVYCANGQKQILHIGVEKYGLNCIALSPKNYIINDEIVLKGVILNQNPQINEQTFVDCINKGIVTTAVNTTLAQRKGIMSRLQMERNAITKMTTKADEQVNQVGQFVPLVADDEFEINDMYPYQIRRIDNKEIKEPFQTQGYYRITLNKKQYLLHRLIAQNFIPNPDNLNEVDHINRDRSDYHIENLPIEALEQLHIDWKSIWKIIYEAGIKYACESKLCR
ncbi:MAG: hypothetical protein EZS28_019941 [Streblomastix strix]|uniref:Uncharacterized protein n=1 Tax=Streblomastix strix TaxID=222440 RepID=A0A5J4VPV6_9EUKA|nr:MAG: hypothetical protein EZS28_019941 [Streblomastix strix]